MTDGDGKGSDQFQTMILLSFSARLADDCGNKKGDARAIVSDQRSADLCPAAEVRGQPAVKSSLLLSYTTLPNLLLLSTNVTR